MSIERTNVLRELIKSKTFLHLPSVYDPIGARLVQQSGFEATYVGGYVSGASKAITEPLLTLTEQVEIASQVALSVTIPVLADAGAGFGEPLHTSRTVKEFIAGGLAGIHIEDQLFPKRAHYHKNMVHAIKSTEFIDKIKFACKTRDELDPNFLIIARTDANSVEGLDKTLDRIKAYEDAGADMIFPEAMKDESEFEKVRKAAKGYLLANMTEFGKSKLLDKKQLENLGYNLVIYPVSTQRLAMQNVEIGLKSIFNDGHQNNIIDKMQTRKRLYELVEYEKYNTPDKKITDFSTEGHE